METQESISEALHREVLEEAGINIQIVEHIGVCDYLIPYELPKRGTTHIHHVAIFFEVQYDGSALAESVEKFEGQDSLGALWVPIEEIRDDNASPLVLQAVQWLKTGKLSAPFQRLDNWIVLNRNDG